MPAALGLLPCEAIRYPCGVRVVYSHWGECWRSLVFLLSENIYIQSCILIQRRMLKNPYVVRKFYIQCREETGGVVLMSREVVNPEIYRVRWWMAWDCKIDQHIFKFEGSPASHISEFHLQKRNCHPRIDFSQFTLKQLILWYNPLGIDFRERIDS